MNKWLLVTGAVGVCITVTFFALRQSNNQRLDKPNSKLESLLSPIEKPSEETSNPAAAEPARISSPEPIEQPASPEVQILGKSISANAAGLNPWEIAKGPLTDPAYYRIVEFLKDDADFLIAVLAEFQGESNLKRLKKLAALLSEVEDPSVRAVATAMLASGNSTSETAALLLLGKIQHRDPIARQTILQVIGTSTEETTLVSALNAIAVADSDADLELKINIVNHISPLTQHHEATVRRHSYNMLFRWAADLEQLLPQLRAGLRDADARVRRSAALGFAGSPKKDQQTKLELFNMLNNLEEIPRNRKAAASALNRLPLLSDEQEHIKAVLKSLRGLR